MLLAGEVTRTPPVDSANWAAIWSVAVAVNEMCVKLGRGGYGKPQSKWTIIEKPLSLHFRHCRACSRSELLSVKLINITKVHGRSSRSSKLRSKIDTYLFPGFHKSLTLFLFGRGTDPPPEMLSSLNLSSSDLSMLSISNTTPPVADHRRSLSLPAREHRIEGK